MMRMNVKRVTKYLETIECDGFSFPIVIPAVEVSVGEDSFEFVSWVVVVVVVVVVESV